LDFCWARIDSVDIPISYKKARALFYDKDKDFWDEQETADLEV